MCNESVNYLLIAHPRILLGLYLIIDIYVHVVRAACLLYSAACVSHILLYLFNACDVSLLRLFN